jgi:hypothetical protein
VTEEAKETPTIESSEDKDLQGSSQKEIPAIIKLISPKDRYSAAILLTILSLTTVAAVKIPKDQFIWVLGTIILSVLLTFIGREFLSSETRRKLQKLKKDNFDLHEDNENLNIRIKLLQDQNSNTASKNNYRLDEVNSKIKEVQIMIENHESPELVMRKVLSVANDIKDQINENSSVMNDGIDAAEKHREYAEEWLKPYPEIKSKRIRRKS